jgi:cytochrome b
VHAVSGGVVLAVAAFRLPWGFIGSRYARFVDFVRGPTAVKDYANSLLKLQPAHHVGHNPAGGWAIVLLLGLGILSGLSGWAIYNDIGGHWLEELHEGLASAMLTVVIVHVPASSPAACCMAKTWCRAMVTGRKQGLPEASHPLGSAAGRWPAAGLGRRRQLVDCQLIESGHAHPACRRRPPTGRRPDHRPAPGRFCGRLAKRRQFRRPGAASETFDFVVLDLGLPRLSGMEVLTRARSRGQTCRS